jgi:hypothetical protein
MSGDAEHPKQCEAFADELAELALGTLSGRTRSEVLDHVGSCARCRVELEQLSVVAEAVQQLSPPMQPPLGFELRLAERLQGASVARPWRFRRAGALITTAAAAVAVLAFGLGALVTGGSGGAKSPSAATNLVSANFTSGGPITGSVLISAGSPRWMLVATQAGGWRGTVTCEVTLSSGEVQTIGTFKLSGEYGVWAAPLVTTGGPVQSARLIDTTGAILASAQIGT